MQIYANPDCIMQFVVIISNSKRFNPKSNGLMTLMTHYALDPNTQLAINQTTNRGRVHNRNFLFCFIHSSNHTPQTKQHVAITSYFEKQQNLKLLSNESLLL